VLSRGSGTTGLGTITPEHTAQREAAIAASRSFVAKLMPLSGENGRAIDSRAGQLSFEESTANFGSAYLKKPTPGA
jgi:hypothetical protein